MQKAIRESLYMEQYLCDTHTLQLAIRDTFEAVPGMKRLMKKTKDLAKMTHQSASVAHQQLIDQCKQMGVKYRKLKNPNETRWNSQEIHFDSVLHLRPVLQVLFQEDDGNTFAPFSLSAAEWKLLQGACTILKPFKVATKMWEAEKTPTLNLVIERLYTLHEGLRTFLTCLGNCRYDPHLNLTFYSQLRPPTTFLFFCHSGMGSPSLGHFKRSWNTGFPRLE